MITDFRKLVKVSLVPLGLLLGGGYALLQLHSPLPQILQLTLPYLPFVLLITGMILSWIFHHSREFNLFLLGLIIYIALDNYIWNPALKVDVRQAYLLLVLLLPINYLLNIWMKERGILNQYGIHRFILLAVQLYLIAWLLQHPQPLVSEVINNRFAALPQIAKTPFSQTTILASSITAVVILIVLLRNPSHLMAGVLFSYLAMLSALHNYQNMSLATLWLCLAALIMLITIIMNAYSLAYLDELTNLPSRRALMQNITTLGKRYCIAMVDVDHFKKFNDRYGHDIGDQVLKKLANQLRLVRGGKAFRYGGEEFTLVFANKTLEEANLLCQNLCHKVEQNPFVLRGKKRPKNRQQAKTGKTLNNKALTITISIGLAEASSELPSVKDVIKQADNALYKAKRNGRNQVAI